jgi:hypothetical protein
VFAWHASDTILFNLLSLLHSTLFTMQLYAAMLNLHVVFLLNRHMVPLESQTVVEKNPSTSVDAKEQVIAVVLVRNFHLVC